MKCESSFYEKRAQNIIILVCCCTRITSNNQRSFHQKIHTLRRLTLSIDDDDVCWHAWRDTTQSAKLGTPEVNLHGCERLVERDSNHTNHLITFQFARTDSRSVEFFSFPLFDDAPPPAQSLLQFHIVAAATAFGVVCHLSANGCLCFQKKCINQREYKDTTTPSGRWWYSISMR